VAGRDMGRVRVRSNILMDMGFPLAVREMFCNKTEVAVALVIDL
jgi:hypothetical protein